MKAQIVVQVQRMEFSRPHDEPGAVDPLYQVVGRNPTLWNPIGWQAWVALRVPRLHWWLSRELSGLSRPPLPPAKYSYIYIYILKETTRTKLFRRFLDIVARQGKISRVQTLRSSLRDSANMKIRLTLSLVVVCALCVVALEAKKLDPYKVTLSLSWNIDLLLLITLSIEACN